jgi:hypothetical protein
MTGCVNVVLKRGKRAGNKNYCARMVWKEKYKALCLDQNFLPYPGKKTFAFSSFDYPPDQRKNPIGCRSRKTCGSLTRNRPFLQYPSSRPEQHTLNI